MKIKTPTLLKALCLASGILLLCSCGKRDVDREIARFQNAERNPEITGIWESRLATVFEFTPDGRLIIPNLQEFYFYTERNKVYTLLPGNNMRNSSITTYTYSIDHDTLIFDSVKFVRFQ